MIHRIVPGGDRRRDRRAEPDSTVVHHQPLGTHTDSVRLQIAARSTLGEESLLRHPADEVPKSLPRCQRAASRCLRQCAASPRRVVDLSLSLSLCVCVCVSTEKKTLSNVYNRNGKENAYSFVYGARALRFLFFLFFPFNPGPRGDVPTLSPLTRMPFYSAACGHQSPAPLSFRSDGIRRA